MIQIQRFVCNMISENTYVVSDETGEAVIIDCGAYDTDEQTDIKTYIERNNLRPVRFIATHGHVDHNFGSKFVYDTWGLKLNIHAADEALITQLPQQAVSLLGLSMTADDFAPVGAYLHADDIITFGHHRLTILETPGHTPGGVFYYCEAEKVAFSGDTLFQGSIGRTDLPGGSMFMLIQSLRMISQLPDDTTVYPGHGEASTIGHEVASNPYLDR